MKILTLIRAYFSNDLYIRIWVEKISVINVISGERYDEEPYIAIGKNAKGQQIIQAIGKTAKNFGGNKDCEVINPFLHPRTLLGNFVAAEMILMHAIREVHKNKIIAPSPRVIVQPMEKLEGDLTQVESRAFKELCLGAGAREVYIHTGKELTPHNFNFDKYKNENN